jgi:hypothetical protein
MIMATNPEEKKIHPAEIFLEALRIPAFSCWVEFPSGQWREHLIFGRHGSMTDALNQFRDLLPKFRSWNADERGIHFASNGAWPVVVVDDVSREGIQEMKREGYDPAAVTMSSPGNYQGWVKWGSDITSPENCYAVSRMLNQRWGDPGAIGVNHRGRLPGFTNPKHLTATGQHPFVRLIEASGQIARRADDLAKMEEALPARAKTPQQQKRGPGRTLIASVDYPPLEPLDKIDMAPWDRAKKEFDDPDASRRDWRAVAALLRRGWQPREIAEMMRRDPEIGRRKPKHQEDYILRTVWKCYHYVYGVEIDFISR